VKRLGFEWKVRLGLGAVVLVVGLVLRAPDVPLVNDLLVSLDIWLFLIIAYDSRALARSEFWYDFEVPRAKLGVFRVVFFSLLAVDSWRQIEHVARYGANNFNVSHLPWLDAVLPMPTSSGILVVFLLQSYLAARVVLGVNVKVPVKLLTVLYGYSYFISQTDSYQHHYLLFLLLLISCFVPWHRDAPTDTDPGDPEPAPGTEVVKSWAVRLLLVQLAFLYGWAAIAKLDYMWLSGDAFAQPLKAIPWMNYYARNMPGDLYATPAQLVLLAETTLVLALLNRRLWFWAIPVGVGLHIGIELAGFEIGLFSYYMMSMYLLVVPNRAYRFVAQLLKGVTAGARDALRRAGDKVAGLGTASWAVLALVVAIGTWLLFLLPFDEVWFLALVTLVVALSPLWRRRSPDRRHTASAVAHVAGCALLVVLSLSTSAPHEMYKQLAGSYRRLGDRNAMFHAYAKLAKISPDFGRSYHYMGDVLRERSEQYKDMAAKQTRKGDSSAAEASTRKAAELLERANKNYAEALAAYHRTHEKDPSDYWAYLWEALLHEETAQRLLTKRKLAEAKGEYQKAIAAAVHTLKLKPKKGNVVRAARRIRQRCRAILQRMQQNRKQPRKTRRRRRRRAPSGQSYQDP